MARSADDREAAEKLWGMIKGVRICMMTTLDENGILHSRPMATLPHAGFDDGTLWFFTRADSPKVHELKTHWRVNLSYADPDKQDYVSVSGVAETVRDRDKIRFLWRDILSTWFPQGVDDPDLALLKVSVDRAEYWDSPSSAMVYAYGYVKAKITGEPPKPGDHAKIAFQ
ncbi:pyridoxamine 5'-phosphate oxidase family protein [Azospirillum sp. Vi22]|uniref:Pyridoxamine 5'-phosphate oxidase n=1 Tax=Azospirillum brasilense TaxID=192 RepID=A0A6L3B3V9_AZOBR|nr:MULTISPECIES: pyridoxamine 5'-phosphate oxidase family protein [Azospirillum]KAA0687052.1 pyridoxamine 5'-phosphate oxidase [Azospirillum brasilense]NUB09492.1 pyridoxamine 5'-phosphate oxidase family protein [Azospirillum baldaniorum]TWA69583.1 general stress protein 26 [Azospirillum baldaniorum]